MMLIRDARDSDLGRVEELEKQCFSLPWTFDMLQGQLDTGNHIFLVCEEEGDVVGYIGLMYVLDEGYISNVAVAPERRRRGLAGQLVSALADHARALGLSFMTLEVRAGNTPAIELYAGLGFAPVGRRVNYYDSPREDAILMTLNTKLK